VVSIIFMHIYASWPDYVIPHQSLGVDDWAQASLGSNSLVYIPRALHLYPAVQRDESMHVDDLYLHSLNDYLMKLLTISPVYVYSCIAVIVHVVKGCQYSAYTVSVPHVVSLATPFNLKRKRVW
jgi:hypothetical protein